MIFSNLLNPIEDDSSSLINDFDKEEKFDISLLRTSIKNPTHLSTFHQSDCEDWQNGCNSFQGEFQPRGIEEFLCEDEIDPLPNRKRRNRSETDMNDFRSIQKEFNFELEALVDEKLALENMKEPIWGKDDN